MMSDIEVNREQPPLRLTHSPLILVLAQVKMTPVTNMERFIPEIQDQLRRGRFPKFSKRVIQAESKDAQGNTLRVEEQTDWIFTNKGDDVSLIVGKNGVNLLTSAYTGFEAFLEPLRETLKVVHQVVDISGVERLGLRYIDLILPTEEKPLSYYLSNQILGLSLEGVGERSAYASQTVMDTAPDQKLVIRFSERPKGIALPPDLLASGLELKKDIELKHRFGLLDSDHFVQFPTETLDFELETVLRRIAKLHNCLDKSFRKAVTKAALQDWE